MMGVNSGRAPGRAAHSGLGGRAEVGVGGPGAHGEVLREPVPAVALDCDGGWLLLDTGMNTALIRDPALRARFHPDPVEQPVLPGPGEPLLDALGAAGLGLADIRAVAISHLHYDHAGGLKHFAGRVPVHIQRAELEYGFWLTRRGQSTTASSGWTSTTRGSTGGRPTATPRSRPG